MVFIKWKMMDSNHQYLELHLYSAALPICVIFQYAEGVRFELTMHIVLVHIVFKDYFLKPTWIPLLGHRHILLNVLSGYIIFYSFKLILIY